jgi:multidrug efflux system membrane fusion protein
VKKGDVLAVIDPRSLQASYDQASAKRQNEALLATAQANSSAPRPEVRQFVAKTDLDTQRNQVASTRRRRPRRPAAGLAVQLQYTRVTAPISGIAGIRAVDAATWSTPAPRWSR